MNTDVKNETRWMRYAIPVLWVAFWLSVPHVGGFVRLLFCLVGGFVVFRMARWYEIYRASHREKLAIKRPWLRYTPPALWLAFWVLEWLFASAPLGVLVVGGFGGAAVVFVLSSWLEIYLRAPEQHQLDKLVQDSKGGHVRGGTLFGEKAFLAYMEATAKGLSGKERDGMVWRMSQHPDRFKADPSVFEGWLRLAGVPIPPAVEPLHFAIAASTGAGKSVTLRGLLADIRRRGDRAIIIDNGGEFMRDFGRDDDLVLSAFDDRSVGWNLQNEVKAKHDWARLSHSVVPDATGNDKPWHEMAQGLLANIGAAVGGDNTQLMEIATGYSAAMLEPIVAGTSSAALTQPGGERTLASIRSVYATHLSSWQYMKAGDFSLREYMQGDDSRWLFLPFQESEFGVARPLLAQWIDILVSAGLERPEGSSRTWVIIDELDTLGTLSSLIAATTKLRKREVRIVTAFQSYSQLETHYGRERATTLLNCFSSKVILRSVDGDTAERLSKELGERERWKESVSQSGGGGGSLNRAMQIERLVLPSEIQSLADLHGYIKLAGDYPVGKCLASIEAGKL